MIHAYTLFTDGNVARTLSKKYGVPYVVAIRDTDVNDFFRYRPYLIKLGSQIMKDASAVFFLSESYKRIVLEKYVPSNRNIFKKFNYLGKVSLFCSLGSIIFIYFIGLKISAK